MLVNNCLSTLILLAIGVQSMNYEVGDSPNFGYRKLPFLGATRPRALPRRGRSADIKIRKYNIEGQPCYHVSKNITGTCTMLVNCDSAFQEVQRQVLPQICGLAATAPIICCPNPKVGDKARSKCLEYSKLREGKCNIKFNRSVNLSDAVGMEFPHMAIFGYRGSDFKGRRYFCSGALISERFVLTTASCANTSSYNEPKYVRLGDLHLQENEDDAEPQEFKIEQIVVHPDYFLRKRYNDIALIKLNRDVEFTSYVRPTCLHVGREFDESGRLLNAGWYYKNDNQMVRRSLFDLTDYERCRQEYPVGTVPHLTEGIVDDVMICAEPETTSCNNDHGNSLQTLRRDVDCMYDMVGMLSFGKTCRIKTLPYVFVRISHFIGWIEKVVWP